MRQVRKGGKSAREAISRVEKKHHKMVRESHRSVKYYQGYKVFVLVYAAENNSKLALFHLRIPNLAHRDRDHLLLFIC